MIKTILSIVLILLFLGALRDWLRIIFNHPIIVIGIVILLVNQYIVPHMSGMFSGWKGWLFFATVVVSLFYYAGKDGDNKED